ncbi:MAG: sensor histidine kinase [Bacteroidia bacterium]
MSLIGVWNKITEIGVTSGQPIVFADKLRNRNKLSVLCCFFSFAYLCYFSSKGVLFPLVSIIFAFVFFLLSILLNHHRKYILSSLLLLINTNFCVLVFSTYLGFRSGIHLYLFTSPLIVLSLFNTNSKKFIYASMASYIATFFIVIIIGKYYSVQMMELTKTELDILYTVNFVFSVTILISLSLFFLLNNNKINTLLVTKNHEMEKEIAIRQTAEKFAKAALKEKELLLGEIHHRVKNNLAIISALINLQIENLKDEESKAIFEDTKDRIYSMALIHNQLYQSKSFAQIEFAQYITDFCSYLTKSYQTNSTIRLIEKVEETFLDIKIAIPCALILNELVTNAFKHAFKNQDNGKIEIGFKQVNNQITFCVSDTGSGMDSKNLQSSSMGMSLITSLIEQIDGTLEYKNNNGSTFLISFPI